MRARRLLTGLSVTPVLVAGCGQILALEGDSFVKPDASAPDAGAVDKQCNGVPVRLDDPRYGCASAGCEPCSIPFARNVRCDDKGACAVATCSPGRADCNGQGVDGCEADLLAPETCGACTTACPEGLVCSSAGCQASCPTGEQVCGRSCVDTAKSIAHCGGCARACSGTNTADPVCEGGACGLACRGGLSACDGVNPANGCGVTATYYRDDDGDTYGDSTVTTTACNLPVGYALVAGDCHDGNPDVRPNQTAFFAVGYTTKTNGYSYDYDCNGKEEEGPPLRSHLTACSPSGCSGSGYLPDAKGQANVFCGATKTGSCSASASGTNAGTPSSCYMSTSTGAPITCR